MKNELLSLQTNHLSYFIANSIHYYFITNYEIN